MVSSRRTSHTGSQTTRVVFTLTQNTFLTILLYFKKFQVFNNSPVSIRPTTERVRNHHQQKLRFSDISNAQSLPSQQQIPYKHPARCQPTPAHIYSAPSQPFIPQAHTQLQAAPTGHLSSSQRPFQQHDINHKRDSADPLQQQGAQQRPKFTEYQKQSPTTTSNQSRRDKHSRLNASTHQFSANATNIRQSGVQVLTARFKLISKPS